MDPFLSTRFRVRATCLRSTAAGSPERRVLRGFRCSLLPSRLLSCAANLPPLPAKATPLIYEKRQRYAKSDDYGGFNRNVAAKERTERKRPRIPSVLCDLLRLRNFLICSKGAAGPPGGAGCHARVVGGRGAAEPRIVINAPMRTARSSTAVMPRSVVLVGTARRAVRSPGCGADATASRPYPRPGNRRHRGSPAASAD